MEQQYRVERNDFLRIITWAIGGLMGIGLGIPAIAYIVGPALLGNKTQEWIRIGSVSKVVLGTPTLFKAGITRKTGWISTDEQILVYVLTEDDREYIAMSNICTHLGCRVRWVSDRERFYCPCHNGVFDKEGKVISGPPPRPLDRYELEVDNDEISIGQLYKVEG